MTYARDDGEDGPSLFRRDLVRVFPANSRGVKECVRGEPDQVRNYLAVVLFEHIREDLGQFANTSYL